ncbi:hypothetical protein OIDMADRAFT_20004 [Oidiodendron maius Zn]|uniref:Hydrophobin n=1 Tax=Oidiodendron maius (strain Zn) TaxID=913774 RepID=A0A0C3CJW7_OIDMZ|nr:hypothetical protein OIDMADRAFT_20004 [Oidiodendron maius Zn]
MKFFALLLAIGLAAAIPQGNPAPSTDQLADDVEAVINAYFTTTSSSCCNTTPCFVGCPVEGSFKLCC